MMRPGSFLRTLVLCAVVFALSNCSLVEGDQQWKLAEAYRNEGQYERAIEEYTRIVNLEQRGALAIRAQENITEIYEEKLKDFPRAIRSEREVYRRTENPLKKMESRLRVARIYSDRMNDFLAASEEYELVFEQFPEEMGNKTPELVLEWARCLMEVGEFAKAGERLNAFRSSFSGHALVSQALFLEAEAYLAARQNDLAAAAFQNLIRSYRGSVGNEALVAESYYGLGMALEAQDKLAQALEAYKSSLSRYPNPRVVRVKIERLQKRKKERRM